MSTAICHNAIASGPRVTSRCLAGGVLSSGSFLNSARHQRGVSRQLCRPRHQLLPPHQYTSTSNSTDASSVSSGSTATSTSASANTSHDNSRPAVIDSPEETCQCTFEFERGAAISIPFFSWWNLSSARTFAETCHASVYTAFRWPVKVFQEVSQKSSLQGAGPVLVSVVVIALLALLLRSLLRLQRQRAPTQAEIQQLERNSDELAKQRRRMVSALVSDDLDQQYVQESSQVADEANPSLQDDSGLAGERLVNPMYWDDPDLKRQWGEFLQGSKLSMVDETGWWDVSDIQRPTGRDLPKTDGIDWDA